MAKFNLNDYETVEERIRRFKKDWPDSDIVTELIDFAGEVNQTRWIVRASVWREKGYERPDATGWAFEVDGAGGMANKTSALENGETSAIGRALANLNYSGNKRATREEMMKVQRAELVPALRTAISNATTLDDLRGIWNDANKAGVLDQLSADIEQAKVALEAK
ncbi:hypothetical protein [uncultured Corynebacterium sp.]|uniref:hypothetical protein n=1 Tax=uncultured Corynebacterium sp. TaxID=159447 RepID=UPI0025926B66|nr:hypothetical protein [uncultured Corynebacterium sp.]